MSTPSTATTVIHPHHYGSSHYGYVHPAHGAQPSPLDPSFAGSARLPPTPSYSAYQPQPTRLSHNSRPLYHHDQSQSLAPQHTPQQSSTPVMNRKTQPKAPDWDSYFKNGPPKEIIVIEDDTPPPNQSRTNNRTTYHVETEGPASKKRRTNQQYQAPPSRDKPSYSNPNTPRFDVSGSGTISTDRTTDNHTTAPTSLGSNDSGRGYAEATTAGQKRKRVTRQQTGADTQSREKKRRDQIAAEIKHHDPYVPPHKIVKHKEDVKVRLVTDRHHHSHQPKFDDDDGHYIVTERAMLTERYSIRRLLGQGTFGKVVEALDKSTNKLVAIKVIRAVQKYRDASRIELRVLSTLASNDSDNKNKCIHLRDCFDYRNHICIVTDLYGQSVFDFLKANTFVPFPSSQIQAFARQLFTSVAFLHDLDLIHTDLKPENILLVSNAYQTFTYNRNIPSSSTTVSRNSRQRRVLLDTDIRLIDFGSATFNDEYHSSVVSTRHYRAPEIILNLGWTFPCDIWSIGCILVEFFTGDALFQTHDNLEHLAMMERVCGTKIEAKIVRQVQKADHKGNVNSAAKYFKATKLDYPSTETSKASKKYVSAMKKLPEIIPASTAFNKQFLDLLKRIFVYDPNKRITARDALKHAWFQEQLIDDGTEAIRLKMEEQRRVAEEQQAQMRMNHRAYR